MARRIKFFSPYMAFLRQPASRALRSVLDPLGRIGLSGGKPAAFHTAKPKLLMGDPEVRSSILRGQFQYAGQSLDVGLQGNPWTIATPSMRFASWLHGFSWLVDGLGIKGTSGHTRMAGLVDSWIVTYGQWNDFAWAPDILSQRLFYWLAFWSPALSTAVSPVQTQRRRTSAVKQLKALRKSYSRVSNGIPRLRAAAAITLGGARLSDPSHIYLARGLDWLDDEIDKQVLPDGGHVSRSPEQTAQALEILLIVDQILQDRGVEGSSTLSRAIDRLAPVVSFFTHADGSLAVFNGGGAVSKRIIKILQANTPGDAKAFGYCPHTGYQRIARDGLVLIMDTSSAPPKPFDDKAHMAPLAFEVSTPGGKLLTSCGWNEQQPPAWRRPVRAAAAHNTLIINDQSPGQLLALGWKTRLFGEVVDVPAGPVKAVRKEQEGGVWLEATQEGYRASYGLSHRRRFYMSKLGDDLRGEDSLLLPLGQAALRHDEVDFDIRFHVHPNVRVSLSQDQASVLLVQDGKSGWRFRSDSGPLKIESSVYLAEGSRPVRSQQIVISGRAYCDSDGEGRSNRVRWSLRKLKSRAA